MSGSSDDSLYSCISRILTEPVQSSALDIKRWYFYSLKGNSSFHGHPLFHGEGGLLNGNDSSSCQITSFKDLKKIDPQKWLPYPVRDNKRLCNGSAVGDHLMIPVLDDFLFDVDLKARKMFPVYWKGDDMEVRQSNWYYKGDYGWVPCPLKLDELLEKSYQRNLNEIEDDVTVTVEADVMTIPRLSNVNAAASSAASSPSKSYLEQLSSFLPSVVVGDDETKSYISDEISNDNVFPNMTIVFQKGLLNSGWFHFRPSGFRITSTIIRYVSNGVKIVRGFQNYLKESNVKSNVSLQERLSEIGAHLESSMSMPMSKDHPIDDFDEKNEENTNNNSQVKNGNLLESESDKCMLDFSKSLNDINIDDPSDADFHHLIFLVHGVGKKLVTSFGVPLEYDAVRLKNTFNAVFSQSPEKYHSIKGKIMIIPICWRLDVEKLLGDITMKEEKSDDSFDSMLRKITLPNMLTIRAAMMELSLDILLYSTPTYGEKILGIIKSEMDRLFKLFTRRHPKFLESQGKVHIVGHSLGSLLAFDLINLQYEMVDSPSSSSNVSSPIFGGVGEGTPLNTRSLSFDYSLAKASSSNSLSSRIIDPESIPRIRRKRGSFSQTVPNPRWILPFRVDKFFAWGSPLGAFLMIKGQKFLGCDNDASRAIYDFLAAKHGQALMSETCVILGCREFYNLFHPNDIIAFRLEPLISDTMHNVKPVCIPAFTSATSTSSTNDVSLTKMIRSIMVNRRSSPSFSKEKKIEAIDTIINDNVEMEDQNNSNNDNNNNEDQSNSSSSIEQETTPLMHFNSLGRVDFQRPVEGIKNQLLAPINAHFTYWGDRDLGRFLLDRLLISQ